MAGGMRSRLHPRERDKRESRTREGAEAWRVSTFLGFPIFEQRFPRNHLVEHSSSGSGIQPGWELGRGLDKADATSG